MKLKKGSLALVTGASSGIGMSFARALAARGLDLVLVARLGDKLKELAAQLSREHGVRVETLTLDLSQPGAAKQVWDAAQKNGWSVDLLINNAGFGKWGEFLDFTVETYAEMLRLNVQTLVELCHFFLPSLLKKPGLGIINVGSTASLVPVPFAGVYGATKAFVLYLTQALREEFPGGVRLQAVLPGATRTEIWERAGRDVNELDPSMVMDVDDLVDAALAGFDQGELVTIPSLPDPADWDAYQAARGKLAPNLSRRFPADRFKAA